MEQIPKMDILYSRYVHFRNLFYFAPSYPDVILSTTVGLLNIVWVKSKMYFFMKHSNTCFCPLDIYFVAKYRLLSTQLL